MQICRLDDIKHTEICIYMLKFSLQYLLGQAYKNFFTFDVISNKEMIRESFNAGLRLCVQTAITIYLLISEHSIHVCCVFCRIYECKAFMVCFLQISLVSLI